MDTINEYDGLIQSIDPMILFYCLYFCIYFDNPRILEQLTKFIDEKDMRRDELKSSPTH